MVENTENPNEPVNPEKNVEEVKEPIVTEAEKLSKDERMWGMLCHLLGMGWLIFPPIGGVLGSLVMWLIKREDYPFVEEQGKEALNFQISMLIYWFISLALFVVCVGPFLMAAVAVADIVFAIIATIKSNEGVHYRYPLTIRFVK